MALQRYRVGNNTLDCFSADSASSRVRPLLFMTSAVGKLPRARQKLPQRLLQSACFRLQVHSARARSFTLRVCTFVIRLPVT
jgi:hypothetical protein